MNMSPEPAFKGQQGDIRRDHPVTRRSVWKCAAVPLLVVLLLPYTFAADYGSEQVFQAKRRLEVSVEHFVCDYLQGSIGETCGGENGATREAMERIAVETGAAATQFDLNQIAQSYSQQAAELVFNPIMMQVEAMTARLQEIILAADLADPDASDCGDWTPSSASFSFPADAMTVNNRGSSGTILRT